MKMKFLFFIVILGLLPTRAISVEGMWLPLLIEKNMEEMRRMGFMLSAQDLYSADTVSIKDGIVRFGRGCTGFFISPEGLLITNHHCGIGQIQQHSTVENDFLTQGFWAGGRGEELPNPGLTITLLVRMEDVTERVVSQIPALATERERIEIIRRVSSEIARGATEGGKYEAQVLPLFHGNKFMLYIHQVFRDVRLVGAPPNSIGKFGGDIDNWEWPRHTGDFALFRVYADANNQPADFSPDNRPYRPAHFFPVSNRPIQKNDFTMVYGFPGRTTQYLTSHGVDFIMNHRNPVAINLRSQILDIYHEDMANSEQVRIQYTTKRARVANTWKRWQGENRGLKRLSAIEHKQRLEKEFDEWAKKTGNEEYANLMEEFAKAYRNVIPYRKATNIYNEAGRAIEIVRFAMGFEELVSKSRERDVAPQMIQTIVNRLKMQAGEFFRDYNPATDRRVAEVMLQNYLQLTEGPLMPPVLREIKHRHNGDMEKFVSRLFERSILVSEKKTLEFLNNFTPSRIRLLERDPAWRLAAGLLEFNNQTLRVAESRFEQQLDSLYRVFVAGLKEKFPGRNFYPDANGTLRITFGKIEGSIPNDGMKYLYYTTSDGILQKALETHIPDYAISDRLDSLLEQGNFAPYNRNGQLIVNFIASNHTTGGNSGSPVLDAQGNFIGINFDRSWESTMSDIFYDVKQCRNISVSSQYILWVIHKYAGKQNLINEMVILN